MAMVSTVFVLIMVIYVYSKSKLNGILMKLGNNSDYYSIINYFMSGIL